MIHKNFRQKLSLLWFVGLLLETLLLYSQSSQELVFQARKQVQGLAIIASTEQIAVQDKIKELDAIIKRSEASLKSMEDKNEKAKLNVDLIKSKHELRSAKKELKNKIIASKKYKNLMSLDDVKLLAELKKQKLLPASQVSEPSSEYSTGSETSKKSIEKQDSSVPKPSKRLQKNENSEVFSFTENPNQFYKIDCIYKLESDLKKAALEPEILFTYTPNELKKHLKGIPYSKGWAFIAREPGYVMLQLNMEIASEQALDYYGNFSKSFMTIKLVNGKEVRLINSGFDSGKIDRYKKASIISGIFNIDKPAEKLLMSSEVDTIKLNLISGFEIYTIYNVDFFTRQLTCINSLK